MAAGNDDSMSGVAPLAHFALPARQLLREKGESNLFFAAFAAWRETIILLLRRCQSLLSTTFAKAGPR